MKFKQVKVDDLSGRLLDYAAGLARGHVWVKNGTPRWGGDKDYPLGALFFVPPSHGKDLDNAKPNWNGWLLPTARAPMGPVPHCFLDLPSHGEGLFELVDELGSRGRTLIALEGGCLTTHMRDQNVWRTEGGTMEGALCRLYVKVKLGDQVLVPVDLLT